MLVEVLTEKRKKYFKYEFDIFYRCFITNCKKEPVEIHFLQVDGEPARVFFCDEHKLKKCSMTFCNNMALPSTEIIGMGGDEMVVWICDKCKKIWK